MPTASAMSPTGVLLYAVRRQRSYVLPASETWVKMQIGLRTSSTVLSANE